MLFTFTHPTARPVQIKAANSSDAWGKLKKTHEYFYNKDNKWRILGNWTETLQVIRKVLNEYRNMGQAGKEYRGDEVIIGDRTFILTGSVTANMIDDSDYNREYGYGELKYLDDFEFEINKVIEVNPDGSEVDVTNNQDVIRMVEEFMEEDLKND